MQGMATLVLQEKEQWCGWKCCELCASNPAVLGHARFAKRRLVGCGFVAGSPQATYCVAEGLYPSPNNPERGAGPVPVERRMPAPL